MPEILVIKGLTYHGVYCQKPPSLFQVFKKPGQINYGVKPFEIAELISIRIVCIQRTLLEL